MADIYLGSGSNTSPFETEAKAATAHTGITPGAGDVVHAEQTHAETPGTTIISWTGTHLNPLQVISVNFDTTETGEYDPGASIITTGTTDLTLDGDSTQWEGWTLKAGDDLILSGADAEMVFIDCTVGSVRTSSSGRVNHGHADGQTIRYYNTTFEFAHASGGLEITAADASSFEIYGGGVSGAITSFVILGTVRSVHGQIYGFDLSTVTNLVDVGTTNAPGSVNINFEQCPLENPYNLITGDMDDFPAGARISASLSDLIDSAGRGAPLTYEHEERGGSSFSVTTHHISSPTSMDGDFYSQRVTAYGGNTVKGMIMASASIILRKYYKGTLGSPVTATVRFAHDAVAWGSGASGRVQTDEVMFTFRGPDDTASQSSQTPFQLSDAPSSHPLGIIEPGNAVAAADHTDDTTSTWTATTPTLSDQQDKQEFSYTWTPEVEGTVEIVCYVCSGDASVDRDVYFSPDIEFS